MNWKALIAGSLLTLCIGLINLGVFVLASAYTGSLGADTFLVQNYRDEIYFAFGFVTFCFSMCAGGFVTAFMANRKEVLHGAIVGALVGAFSLFNSTSVGDVSVMSLVLFVFSGLCGGAGGWLCGRASVEENAIA